VNGQITGHVGGIFASLLDRRALKSDLREFCCIEKIRRPEIIVPHFYTGIDASYLNGYLNGRLFRIRLIELNLAGEVVEFAGYFGKQVTDLKTHRRMGLVEDKGINRKGGMS
jgi:hypothetical protein